ncbi:MAG: hypothetical protein NTX79_02895 [Candidatus Micrarchaeota archaeon]|nr:hypothetical protein [Candidatus Micrarchaeota archaeon]
MLLKNPGKVSTRTFGQLYALEKRAFADCGHASLDRFRDKFSDDAIIATSKNSNGRLVGLVMAKPFEPVQTRIEGKDALLELLGQNNVDGKISLIEGELGRSKLYYVNNLIILENTKANFTMMQEFFNALRAREVRAVSYHGRMDNDGFRVMEKIFARNSFDKICSFVQARPYGDSMFTVYYSGAN